jgi:MGT family glycosyltransferase
MSDFFSGKKVLFANVPLDGHFNPLTALAKHLQNIGCEVRWYASAIFSEQLERLGIFRYEFVKAKELNGRNLHVEIPGLATASGGEKGRLYLKNVFIDRATEYFEDIVDIYSAYRFEFVITDSMFSAIPFIKYALNVPVVAIGIIPLMEDSVDTAPAGRALPPARNEELRSVYAEMYKLKYAGIADLIDNYRMDLKRYSIHAKGSFLFDTLIKEANLYLQIGIPAFEYKRSDLSGNIRFIGSLLPHQAAGSLPLRIQEKLKKYTNVVLVTQGTLERDINKLLEPTINAFLGKDILVIVTTGGGGTDQLRAKYHDHNVIIEDYVPYKDIMPYVSVFITNGGYGGTMLSLSHGIPIVAAGVYELKNEICARIAYFGLGIDLQTETPTSNEIYQATHLILTDDTYRKKVQRFRREMRQYDSMALSTTYIETLLNEQSK